jgi:hypothetical protein
MYLDIFYISNTVPYVFLNPFDGLINRPILMKFSTNDPLDVVGTLQFNALKKLKNKKTILPGRFVPSRTVHTVLPGRFVPSRNMHLYRVLM